MTSNIRGILLVPADGDPHGLLQEGPCGARPSDCERADALVLAYAGQPVHEGCYRVAVVSGYAPSAVLEAVKCVLDGAHPRARSIAGLGSIVLLDGDEREATDGE